MGDREWEGGVRGRPRGRPESRDFSLVLRVRDADLFWGRRERILFGRLVKGTRYQSVRGHVRACVPGEFVWLVQKGDNLWCG